ncbi:MAG TPA: hypothetical protein PKD99_02450 [Sphingopyxis sp.]|nr:hypothetical protein [Sphingopyxis sp.]HMP43938.1 hypothetical protein [Sphingopyxis sp.]HMQ20025.1 hypothetical protein [Sphingopyxis sp.]
MMGGKRILDDAQVDEACALRERGYSCERIARHFQARGIAITRGSIAWLCLVNGADLPPHLRRPQTAPAPGIAVKRGGHVMRTFTAEDDRRLLALEAAGLNYSEIARNLDRKPNSIRGRLATLARNQARADCLERTLP